MGSFGSTSTNKKFIEPPGFEPGTPIKHPFSGLMAVRSEGVIYPLPRKQIATGNVGLRVLLRIGCGLKDYVLKIRE